MKKSILLFIGTLGLWMQLSAAQGYQNNPNEQNRSVYATSADQMTNSQGRYATEEDRRLADRIRDKLKGWFSNGYADLVTIDINNGNVTIRGIVEKPDDKTDIDNKVRIVEGVRSLNNQVTVRGNTNTFDRTSSTAAVPTDDKFPQDRAATTRDRQLNQAIRNKISNGFFFTYYKDVQIDTNNGSVTLQGLVKDRAEEDKLVGDIQKINGVTSVTSNLRIKV